MTLLDQLVQGDEESRVASRRLPTTVAFLVALAALSFPDLVDVRHSVLAGIAIVGAGLLTAVSYLLQLTKRAPSQALVVFPLLDAVLITALCVATGRSSSVFVVMLALPLVSLASLPGRQPLLSAVVLIPVVTVICTVTTSQPLVNASAAGRGVLLLVFLALAGLTTNEAFTRLRRRNEGMAALQHKQAELLVRASDQSRELVALNRQFKGARETLGGIIDAAAQSIIGTDLDGQIRVFNPGAEKAWGYKREDVLRRMSILALHAPDELDQRRRELGAPSAFEALVSAARAGKTDVHDWTYLTHDGEERDVEVAITPRFDSQGNLAGFLFAATDMTERRAVERLKDEFVSLVSHELRTPLTSILGYLELVFDEADHSLDATQLHYLSTIQRNADRLLHHVDDLLFSTQVESGGFTLVREPVDVTALGAAILESAQPAAAEAKLSVETDLQPGVRVAGDPNRLTQAIDNLVSNAIKFTPAGGAILLAVRETTDEAHRPVAEILVEDTGIGIPANEIDMLFTRFFRASTATKNAIAGAGLGLSIAHTIAIAHGGTLRVRSREGEGSTVTLTLPMEQELASV